jgi:hypothetical protein
LGAAVLPAYHWSLSPRPWATNHGTTLNSGRTTRTLIIKNTSAARWSGMFFHINTRPRRNIAYPGAEGSCVQVSSMLPFEASRARVFDAAAVTWSLMRIIFGNIYCRFNSIPATLPTNVVQDPCTSKAWRKLDELGHATGAGASITRLYSNHLFDLVASVYSSTYLVHFPIS